MSLFVYVDGTIVPTHRIRLRGNGDQGVAVAAAADGSAEFSGIVFDDDDGTLTIPAWRQLVVEEPDCTTARRLFTGYIGDRTYRRGHYRLGAGREIDTTVLDANILLRMHRINGADSLRPEETDTERLAWLLTSGYIPLVSDLGFVNGADRVFEATQYKGQLPSDVLDDLIGPRGQIYFVYYDQSAQALGLFYDDPTATTYTSTLTLSNVLSDVNETTCFAPYEDASSTLDPSEIYSNIRYVYKGGAVYRANLTTAATYFPLPVGHRDTMVENDRVGKTATAIRFADRILARDSTEAQRIDLTVKLPASKVGLIQPGMRLGVRLTYVPGFETLAYTRVESWSVVQTDNAPEFYDVTLRLSTHGRVGGGGTGGGSTQPFPPAAGTPGTLVQVGNGFASVILPAAPTDGNFLLCWMTERGVGTYPGTPAGWTSIATAKNLSAFSDQYYARLVYKIASGESSTVVIFGTGNIDGTVMEWAGVELGNEVHQSDVNVSNSTTVVTAGGTITPSAANAILVGCAVVGTFGGTAVAPDTEVTELADVNFGGSNDPTNWVGYKTATSTAATVVGGNGFPGSRNEYGGVTVALIPTSTTEPPVTGQPVIDETPTPAPGGGNTVFFTLNPYAPGSLQVWVDQVEQTAAVTETNPQTGEFSLAFDPRSWEVLTCTYIGG